MTDSAAETAAARELYRCPTCGGEGAVYTINRDYSRYACRRKSCRATWQVDHPGKIED